MKKIPIYNLFNNNINLKGGANPVDIIITPQLTKEEAEKAKTMLKLIMPINKVELLRSNTEYEVQVNLVNFYQKALHKSNGNHVALEKEENTTYTRDEEFVSSYKKYTNLSDYYTEVLDEQQSILNELYTKRNERISDGKKLSSKYNELVVFTQTDINWEIKKTDFLQYFMHENGYQNITTVQLEDIEIPIYSTIKYIYNKGFNKIYFIQANEPVAEFNDNILPYLEDNLVAGIQYPQIVENPSQVPSPVPSPASSTLSLEEFKVLPRDISDKEREIYYLLFNMLFFNKLILMKKIKSMNDLLFKNIIESILNDETDINIEINLEKYLNKYKTYIFKDTKSFNFEEYKKEIKEIIFYKIKFIK